MIDDIKFNNEYIANLKKRIINYVSRTSINTNKITYLLGLFTKFIIEDNNEKTVTCNYPYVKDRYINNAIITVGTGFLEVKDSVYYIKQDYEYLLAYKILCILVKGCSLDIKADGSIPLDIIYPNYNSYYESFTSLIAEDVNKYVIPDFADNYAFNKKVVRMLMAIAGKKYALNTYFKQDDSFKMMIYSISSDNDLYQNIDKELTLITRLTNTLNSKDAIINNYQNGIIKMVISNHKHRLINIIIDELYIPYINSVGLDERKIVRDDILKGFLGNNYANLKLTDENKDSYYWASLINNTVPINNKVGEQARAIFKEQIIKDDNTNTHNLYVKVALEKAKKNVKEFYVFDDKGKVKIKTGANKTISQTLLVDEILSYAYLNGFNEEGRKKVETGIISLCEKGTRFKCSLKGTPLNNKMMIAGVRQLAHKNGYSLTLIGDIDSDKVEFDIKKDK